MILDLNGEMHLHARHPVAIRSDGVLHCLNLDTITQRRMRTEDHSIRHVLQSHVLAEKHPRDRWVVLWIPDGTLQPHPG